MPKILCVDPDPASAGILENFLGKKKYDVQMVSTGNDALKQLKKEDYDLVISDFRLPDIGGIELIRSLKALKENTQIIILTSYSDVRSVVRSIKQGAYDYVAKPIVTDELLDSIKRALRKQKKESQPPEKVVRNKRLSVQYVRGESEEVKRAHNLAAMVAPTDMSVLIFGESGTGKEVAAKTIHKQSKRKTNPFVAVDCGALPKELASSILFGHKKGAFTGALNDRTGLFEAADGGTLFLDEIGNLSYENQIKLLRAVQEHRIRKVGDTNDIKVDVRIIAATNEDLQELVQDGEFREDLYFRLNEFSLNIPPLRSRGDDVMLYAEHFRKLANKSLNKDTTGFTTDVKNKFLEYNWPGNLREMMNVIKRAVLISNGAKIGINSLPVEILNSEQPMINGDLDNIESSEITDLKSVVAHAEKTAILRVLSKTGFNKSRTAQILNVDRKTLYNKISAYNIDHKFR